MSFSILVLKKLLIVDETKPVIFVFVHLFVLYSIKWYVNINQKVWEKLFYFTQKSINYLLCAFYIQGRWQKLELMFSTILCQFQCPHSPALGCVE